MQILHLILSASEVKDDNDSELEAFGEKDTVGTAVGKGDALELSASEAEDATDSELGASDDGDMEDREPKSRRK